MKFFSEKFKEKFKDRFSVKLKDFSKFDKSIKDGINDKYCNKIKIDLKLIEKIIKSENLILVEKSKDVFEEKQKNVFTSDSNVKVGKSIDVENKGNGLYSLENSERNGEKLINFDNGSCLNALSDQCKDNKSKGKYFINEKFGKLKYRDEIRVKVKEKYLISEKLKDKVLKESKSFSKKEENKVENGKDNIERKIEFKIE